MFGDVTTQSFTLMEQNSNFPFHCHFCPLPIGLSLRFELMCLPAPALDASGNLINDEHCPSVGLKKIQKLSRLGAHEDIKHGSRNSMSTPDLVGYFGNMLI